MKLLNTIAEFVTNPITWLALLFLVVDVLLMQTPGPIKIKLTFLALMAIPAMLGYMIGRRRR